ncbi:MAG: RloB family protein [Actinomycetota bacterium]
MRRQPGGRPTRRRPTRATLPIVAIIAEGEVTEAQYFTQFHRALRARLAVDLRNEGRGCDPLTIVREARRLLVANEKNHRRGRGRDFDELWCVFDVDEHETLDEASVFARDHGVNVAVSNPCFEIWLWWHHGEQTAHIERHGIQRRCREAGLIRGKELVEDFVPAHPQAARRASEMDRRHSSAGSPLGSNPSSGMPELMSRLFALALPGK